jgi:hypothetical protein
MDPHRKNDDRQQQAHRPLPPGALSYVAAAGLAVPVGALAWFEAAYLCFGLTGEDPPEAFSFLAAVVSFGFAFGWMLFRARRPAHVVRRGCQLGLLISVLLPVVVIAVLLLWQNASDRPDLGMGGLMFYTLPYIALGVAAVLAIVFGLGIRLAERRLHAGR